MVRRRALNLAQTKLCCTHAFMQRERKRTWKIQREKWSLSILLKSWSSIWKSDSWSMLKYSIRPRLRPSVVRDLNGNSGRGDGDYLWSTWVFVRVANMTGGGKGWVVPRRMLIPDIWMRRHPTLKFPGDGSSPWQHSASKYVWWSDTRDTGRMNCEQLAPNCLSFPEHSLNIVHKDAFPPPDNWTELLWSQRCR